MNSAVDPMSPRDSRRSLVISVLLALLAIACYLPSLVDRNGKPASEFFSDDLRFISDNQENLAHWAKPWRYFQDATLVATPDDGDIYRPLRTWSFALDLQSFGAAPFAFRAHNILLHALVVFLLHRLLRSTPGLAGGATFAAACFAAHPLASEAVAWISSRADLQAALLVLTTLLLARRAENGASAWLVAAAAAACGFAKESACVVPALVLLDHLLRHQKFERTALRPCLAAIAGVVVYLAVYLAVRDRGIVGQVEYYGGSLSHHLPFAIHGIARQLSLLVWPTRLNFNYEPVLFANATTTDLLSALGIILLTVGFVVVVGRRCSAVVLGASFYAIAIAPSANLLLPLRSVLAERFAYVPLLGFAIVVAALVPAIARRLARFGRGIPVLCGLLALCALGARTAARAAEHHSPLALYRSTAESWPNSYSAALGLGNVAMAHGDFSTAINVFERSIALAGVDATLAWKAQIALGRAFVLKPDLQRAVATLAEACAAVDRNPTLAQQLPSLDAECRFALATALALAQRYADAANVYDDLMVRHGETAERLDARAEVERARVGSTDQIIDLYQRALLLDANYHKARIHLATFFKLFPALEIEGRKQLREVLYRDPNNAEALRIEAEWKAEAGR